MIRPDDNRSVLRLRASALGGVLPDATRKRSRWVRPGNLRCSPVPERKVCDPVTIPREVAITTRQVTDRSCLAASSSTTQPMTRGRFRFNNRVITFHYLVTPDKLLSKNFLVKRFLQRYNPLDRC